VLLVREVLVVLVKSSVKECCGSCLGGVEESCASCPEGVSSSSTHWSGSRPHDK